MKKIIIAALLGIAGALAVAAPAAATGSDSPTPYTVDATGITLPIGSVFEDNGHINIKTSAGDVGLHFEAKCITRTDAECAGARHDAAQLIGKSFAPWSAFGKSCPATVTWVQLSQYNEHYGEGGQPGIEIAGCGTPTPEPTVTPNPKPTSTSTSTPTPAPQCGTEGQLACTPGGELAVVLIPTSAALGGLGAAFFFRRRIAALLDRLYFRH